MLKVGIKNRMYLHLDFFTTGLIKPGLVYGVEPLAEPIHQGAISTKDHRGGLSPTCVGICQPISESLITRELI